MSGDVWGLISDVHGNFPALQQALAVLSDAGAVKFAFLGDYLGRGDSDACIKCIREVADLAVVGNRDLDWQDRVNPDSKAYVLGLPKQAQCQSLLVSHGDARLTPALSTSQIARGFPRTFAEMERSGAHVWAFGHSHHARVWRDADLVKEERVCIEQPSRYCVNVGTTGLPFPGKGGQSVALIDFERAEIRQISLTRV